MEQSEGKHNGKDQIDPRQITSSIEMGTNYVGGFCAVDYGSDHDGHPGSGIAVYLLRAFDFGTGNRVGERAQ